MTPTATNSATDPALMKQMIAALSRIHRVSESARYASKLPVSVGKTPARALLDSGNTFSSAISEKFLRKMGLTTADLDPLPIDHVGSAKTGAGLKILGKLKTPTRLRLGGLSATIPFQPVVLRDLAMEVNLSGPFMKAHHIDQLHSSNAISVGSKGTRVKLIPPDSKAPQVREPCRVFSLNAVTIPPLEERVVELRVPAFERGSVQPSAGLLQGNVGLEQSHDVHTYRNVLLTPDATSHTLTAGLYNTTDEPIEVPAGAHYGWFTPDYGNENCRVAALQGEALTQQEETSAPEWARGPTTRNNYKKRVQYLLKTFKLKENPLLKRTEDLAALIAVLLRTFEVFAIDGVYGRTELVEHRIQLQPGT